MLWLVFALFYCTNSADYFGTFRTRASNEGQLRSLRNTLSNGILSADPLFSECHRDAMTLIENDCDRLTTDDQRRYLAFRLTRCHLISSGIHVSSTKCDVGDFGSMPPIQECLTAYTRDEKQFNAYTLFFQHVESYCLALAADHWRQVMYSAVNGMIDVTEETRNRLEFMDQVTGEMEQKVSATLKLQESVDERSLKVQASLIEMTKVQKTGLDELRIALQRDIAGSLSSLKSKLGLLEGQHDELFGLSGDMKSNLEESFETLKESEEELKSSLALTAETTQHIDSRTAAMSSNLEKMEDQHRTLMGFLNDITEQERRIIEAQQNVENGQERLLKEVDEGFVSVEGYLVNLKKRQAETLQSVQNVLEKSHEAAETFGAFISDLFETLGESNQQLETFQRVVESVNANVLQQGEEMGVRFTEIYSSLQAGFDLVSMIVGSWATFFSILFYFGFTLTVLALTSPPSTARVRLRCLLLGLVNCLVEILVLHRLFPGSGVTSWIRVATGAIVLSVILYGHISYRDAYALLQRQTEEQQGILHAILSQLSVLNAKVDGTHSNLSSLQSLFKERDIVLHSGVQSSKGICGGTCRTPDRTPSGSKLRDPYESEDISFDDSDAIEIDSND